RKPNFWASRPTGNGFPGLAGEPKSSFGSDHRPGNWLSGRRNPVFRQAAGAKFEFLGGNCLAGRLARAAIPHLGSRRSSELGNYAPWALSFAAYPSSVYSSQAPLTLRWLGK